MTPSGREKPDAREDNPEPVRIEKEEGMALRGAHALRSAI
jgi:hypothetical protein